MLMLVFRLLTWLGRDEQTLLLLSQQSHLGEVVFAPQKNNPSNDWMYSVLDPQSWLVVLTWIFETCSTKTFLLASLLCPPEFSQAVLHKFLAIVCSQDDMGMMRLIST
jgi:hypothetical protein